MCPLLSRDTVREDYCYTLDYRIATICEEKLRSSLPIESSITSGVAYGYLLSVGSVNALLTIGCLLEPWFV